MSQFFVSKTNYAFYQTVFTSFVAVTAMIFVFLKVYQIFGLYLGLLIHKIKDACGCASMTQFFAMHPDIFRVVILFGVGIGIFIFYSLYKLFKLNSNTKKYIEHYLFYAGVGCSPKLKSAIKLLDLDKKRVVEIDNPELVVFCFGFWRPKICISSALVEMLSKDELKVVLAHEAQHMAAYEPLKVFIVKYFTSILFFLPGLRTSAKKYIIFSELAADEKAGEGVRSRSGLAKAILKISDSSLSFFSPTIEERANRLSDDAYVPKFNFLDKSLIVGSLGLVIVSSFAFFVFFDSAKALEMHSESNCVFQEKTERDLFCSLANQQKNNNKDNVIVHGADSINFNENSICKVK